MEGPIPDSVARFIAAHVRSLEQLEILLLLAAHPDKAWSEGDVYDVIRSNHVSVTQRLEEFRAQGLLIASGPSLSYRFVAPNKEMAETVELLGELYKERRVKIVEMIYAPTVGPLKSFADAFKFKKE